MKYVIIFSLLLTYQLATAQQLIFRDNESFGFVNQGKIRKVPCSFSILKGEFVEHLLNWGIDQQQHVYWTNGESIYALNSQTGTNKRVVSGLHFIYEFFVGPDCIYVVYHPKQTDDDDLDYRFQPGLKFIKIDLKTFKQTPIAIPDKMNFTGLTVSPDGKTMAFYHTRYPNNPKRIAYQMVLYRPAENTYKVIDSARRSQYQWFGEQERLNIMQWVNNDELLYYKYASLSHYGSLFRYNSADNKVTLQMKSFPNRAPRWFYYKDGYCYFSIRNLIYRSANGLDFKRVLDVSPGSAYEVIMID